VEFISIAEESGLIVPLGARVLELACEQTARWRAAHPELANLHVAVNLSARQLADPNLESTVRAVLARTGLPRDALWLEITESMLVSDTDSSRVLFALRAAGVHLSIDDFGTGYSNLGYLRRFPVEVLKIDRSFVMAMDESDDAAAIVASVTALAHTLGLKVIAEGVENAAQLAALRRLGCDQLQGYYLGRPARADDIVGTLLRRDLLG
jgi:EAL domain-containing protein (putative c-di-GMP-specific phosphodiesterase class I)